MKIYRRNVWAEFARNTLGITMKNLWKIKLYFFLQCSSLLKSAYRIINYGLYIFFLVYCSNLFSWSVAKKCNTVLQTIYVNSILTVNLIFYLHCKLIIYEWMSTTRLNVYACILCCVLDEVQIDFCWCYALEFLKGFFKRQPRRGLHA